MIKLMQRPFRSVAGALNSGIRHAGIEAPDMVQGKDHQRGLLAQSFGVAVPVWLAA
jgi:hypothetical protein